MTMASPTKKERESRNPYHQRRGKVSITKKIGCLSSSRQQKYLAGLFLDHQGWDRRWGQPWQAPPRRRGRRCPGPPCWTCPRRRTAFPALWEQGPLRLCTGTGEIEEEGGPQASWNSTLFHPVSHIGSLPGIWHQITGPDQQFKSIEKTAQDNQHFLIFSLLKRSAIYFLLWLYNIIPLLPLIQRAKAGRDLKVKMRIYVTSIRWKRKKSE